MLKHIQIRILQENIMFHQNKFEIGKVNQKKSRIQVKKTEKIQEMFMQNQGNQIMKSNIQFYGILLNQNGRMVNV